MNFDLIEMVSDDLEYLAKEFHHTAEDAEIRRGSAVLRKLISDGLLADAAREVDIDISIMALEIRAALTLPEFRFYQLGGGRCNGYRQCHATVRGGAPTDEEIKSLFASKPNGQIDKKKLISLNSYIDQPSYVLNGMTISHREVVKYVANKLGGTHLDSSRRDAKLLDEKFRVLDSIRTMVEMVYTNKNSIYFELLSIGQCISDSRDIHKLRRRLKEVLAPRRSAVWKTARIAFDDGLILMTQKKSAPEEANS